MDDNLVIIKHTGTHLVIEKVTDYLIYLGKFIKYFGDTKNKVLNWVANLWNIKEKDKQVKNRLRGIGWCDLDEAQR